MEPDNHFIPDHAFLLVLIRTVLVLHKGLTWGSSHDYPIQAVRLPWYKMYRWEREPSGIAEQRLKTQVEMNDSPGMLQLCNALASRTPVSYVRTTENDTVEDLYIVVSFGWYAVGIRTQIVAD